MGLWSSIKNAVSDAANAVADAVETAVDKVAEVVSEAVETVGNVVEDTVNAVADMVEKIPVLGKLVGTGLRWAANVIASGARLASALIKYSVRTFPVYWGGVFA